MAVNFNTQTSPSVTIPQVQEEKPIPAATQKALDSFESSIQTIEKLTDSAPYEKNDKAEKKEAIKNKYKNISYTKAGLIGGLATGLLTGTAVAGVDMLVSGIVKARSGEIKWMQILNPSKAQSSTGKYLAPIMALVFFFNSVIRGVIGDNRKKKLEAAGKNIVA